VAFSVSNSGKNGASAGAATISVSANAGDVIVLFIGMGGTSGTATVASVSGGGLTWTKRAAITPFTAFGNSLGLEEWYAIAASAVSAQTITVTSNLTSSQSIDLGYVSISAANTTTPYDANGALPNLQSDQSGSPAVGSISTTNANTILLSAIVGLFLSSGNQPSGWTDLGVTIGIGDAAYNIVSSAQSSASVSWASGGLANWGMICDAVQAAGASSNIPAIMNHLRNQGLA
jgi:hypothetical protein